MWKPRHSMWQSKDENTGIWTPNPRSCQQVPLHYRVLSHCFWQRKENGNVICKWYFFLKMILNFIFFLFSPNDSVLGRKRELVGYCRLWIELAGPSITSTDMRPHGAKPYFNCWWAVKYLPSWIRSCHKYLTDWNYHLQNVFLRVLWS